MFRDVEGAIPYVYFGQFYSMRRTWTAVNIIISQNSAKMEVTLNCSYIQSRVTSDDSWYLTSFVILTFVICRIFIYGFFQFPFIFWKNCSFPFYGIGDFWESAFKNRYYAGSYMMDAVTQIRICFCQLLQNHLFVNGNLLKACRQLYIGPYLPFFSVSIL